MTDTLNTNASLGRAIHAITGKWGWFVALGIGWAGFHMRPAAGWRWIVAAGVLTFCVGIILVAAWPGIGLWLLGAMLVVDLVFQGWGLLAFGLALKARASRHSSQLAAV
jgi:uncharacterized membrane protein HdeD (DUF308 family)